MAPTPVLTTDTLIAALGSDIFQLLNVADASDISADPQALDVIAEVNSLVDGYLRPHYKIPLFQAGSAGVDPAVRAKATDIAVFRLIAKTRRELASPGAADEVAHDSAIAWFRDVASGKVAVDQDIKAEGDDYTFVGSRTAVLREDVRAVETEATKKARWAFFRDW